MLKLGFAVVFYRSEMNDHDDASDKMSDDEDMSDKMSDNKALNDKDYYQAIISYLKKHGEINAATTANIIGRSPATARRVLTELAKDGVLIKNGGNRNRTYNLRNDIIHL
jgi:Fic family protein